MKIIDILLIIYLLLVLVGIIAIRIIKEGSGSLIYMFSMILIIYINQFVLGIFNINYLNSNDTISKRIINTLIGLTPIVTVILVFIPGWDTEDEKFSNTKTSLMQKIINRLNNIIKK
jgi:hypothetical protein